MIIKYLNGLLNKTPMYSLVVYVLSSYVLAAFILSFLGKLSFTPTSLFYSLIILFIICVGGNFILAKFLRIPHQYESSIITAITLFLILLPAESNTAIYSLIIAALVATVSKYFITLRNTHIFNPAALGIFTASTVFGFGTAFWWVGSMYLFPLVLVGGIIILLKTRRYELIFAALCATFLNVFIVSHLNNLNILNLIYTTFISGPIIYFLSPMLQEPHTMAKNKRQQIIYGFLVTFLPTIFILLHPIFFFSMTPELALLMGNFFTFISSKRKRFILRLKRIEELTPGIFEYVFESENLQFVKSKFKAGEYMEWCLPHENADSRSIRRYFTISSSPLDLKEKNEIAFATKFPTVNAENMENKNSISSFKKALKNLKVGERIFATQLSGDFLWPKNPNKNLVLIAGGIGVTPFISQIREQIQQENAKHRNVTLFYCVRNISEVAYLNLFKKAVENTNINLKVILVVGDNNSGLVLQESKNIYIEAGYLNVHILNKYLQDFKNTEFFLSGPNSMVDALENALNECDIKNSKIHKDYFPGF